ncbi:MAG: D-alanyl-D-alanine carboxypeptidase [Actinomycetota bacterium]
MSLSTVLGRLVLPVVLGAAAIAAWLVADRMGDLSVEAAVAPAPETLATPMTSVRRLPSIAEIPLNEQRRELAVAPLGSVEGTRSCVVVMVDGEVVHDIRGDLPVLPGVAQLLQTSYTAVEILGPNYMFETAVLAEERPDDNGRVTGNLYLIGGGDPVLMTRDHQLTFDEVQPRTRFEDLARGLMAIGVTSVSGGVIGVERRFDTQRVLPGWPASYLDQGEVGPLSALQVNDGYVDRQPEDGSAPVVAEDPAAAAAVELDDLLEAGEVQINALARSIAEDEELAGLVTLSRVQSRPLTEILAQVIEFSDAGAAELILKEVGLEFRRAGSTRSGGEAVETELDALGVELGVTPRDASGIDPVATSSCHTLAQTIGAIPLDHPVMGLLPSYDDRAVFDGGLAAVELDADVRVVAGSVGETTSLVARTVDDGPSVVMVTLVNRVGGTRPRDVKVNRDLLQSVDGLQEAWQPVTMDG